MIKQCFLMLVLAVSTTLLCGMDNQYAFLAKAYTIKKIQTPEEKNCWDVNPQKTIKFSDFYVSNSGLIAFQKDVKYVIPNSSTYIDSRFIILNVHTSDVTSCLLKKKATYIKAKKLRPSKTIKLQKKDAITNVFMQDNKAYETLAIGSTLTEDNGWLQLSTYLWAVQKNKNNKKYFMKIFDLNEIDFFGCQTIVFSADGHTFVIVDRNNEIFMVKLTKIIPRELSKYNKQYDCKLNYYYPIF